jgi:GTP-binding protein HflX
MRGAGEKQLELDQRMIGQRIKAINKGLEKVRGQRDQGRRSRRRSEVATISLVGYTNAGKSSLFNKMAHAHTYAADQLFATLDSTLRRITLKNYGPVVVADTVGFISHLPHQLVEAFRATLEETAQADLLIHVVDTANEFHPDHIFEVDKVLAEIGAKSVPQLLVFNKIDLLPGVDPHIQRNEKGKVIKVWVSAKTGAGMDLLQGAMSELLAGNMAVETLRVSPSQTKLRSQLYASGFIEEEHIDEEGFYELRVKLPRTDLDRILKKSGTEIVSHTIAVQEQINLAVEITGPTA